MYVRRVFDKNEQHLRRNASRSTAAQTNKQTSKQTAGPSDRRTKLARLTNQKQIRRPTGLGRDLGPPAR